MANTANFTSVPWKSSGDFSTTLGIVGVMLFFVAAGCISYWNIHTLNWDSRQVAQTHEVITGLDELLSLVKDAETGQRGYVLTGDRKYLQPYDAAIAQVDGQINEIKKLIGDDPDEEIRLSTIKRHIDNKLQELAETVELRRDKGFDAALAVVVTDRGKNEMDVLRSQLSAIQQQQHEIRSLRTNEMQDAFRIAVGSVVMTGLLGIFLSAAVAFLIRRATMLRQRQEWMQNGEVGLSQAMLGDQRMEQLGENILKFLAGYFDAQAGAFFTKNGSSFHRVAIYGIPAGAKVVERFEVSDGLLGQAVKDARTFIVRDVPEDYLTIGSGLGQAKPRHLFISSASSDGHVNAVLELGFIRPIDDAAIQLLEQVAELIGVAVRSATYRESLQNFLEETQRQAEELQAQGEELRVSNEELEEQSRSLKESQFRLEQQQSELEQTNSQLEEQAKILEDQRDDLLRTKSAVQLKARELEQASKYKSDFLANMSHELRTPLNSSLILSKLLADNPHGNLTEEQIKFAQTIQSSGNDLLSLINDILDLSKIEAGYMNVAAEDVKLDRLAEGIKRLFDPIAAQKGLIFEVDLSPSCTKIIVTDPQRLEQIIKNLLSNAVKFTESGSVKFTVEPAENDKITFSVTDTGIGIPEEQQQAIFEAFRQADGTISRKYGGTGLGLSISRELTRLLGGHLTLKSSAGEGSTFTFTLPGIYAPDQVAPRAAAPEPPPPANTERTSDIIPFHSKTDAAPVHTIKRISHIEDDRDKPDGSDRVILIVEDDESFARILRDLTHELDFQCLIAGTAEEALALAMRHLPSAVVLDVGLPDNSGLSVLDRLKQNPRTRHIPVHVVSAGDYAQTALSLGAISYMVKPVKREQLVDTFKKLESRLSQQMRRVLVVEDDAVQRDSVRKLLGAYDVETVGVGTAAECLEQLKNSTFDCMVLDLSLPDASGYSLLETLSKEDAYSFPPVIVYTGRDLSVDQEQRLRKYSRSIIIKGAKSPERLLDEVTLFLHRVVTDLPPEQQRMLEKARNRDAVLEGRRIMVVEDDVRNIYALTSILEPRGAMVQIARNGREAIALLNKSLKDDAQKIDLVLMDVMMPEMDGMTATREIRTQQQWKKLPIIMLTAKAMKDDQEKCLAAGANDYMAKPLDVEKLLSLVRVWMPR